MWSRIRHLYVRRNSFERYSAWMDVTAHHRLSCSIVVWNVAIISFNITNERYLPIYCYANKENKKLFQLLLPHADGGFEIEIEYSYAINRFRSLRCWMRAENSSHGNYSHSYTICSQFTNAYVCCMSFRGCFEDMCGQLMTENRVRHYFIGQMDLPVCPMISHSSFRSNNMPFNWIELWLKWPSWIILRFISMSISKSIYKFPENVFSFHWVQHLLSIRYVYCPFKSLKCLPKYVSHFPHSENEITRWLRYNLQGYPLPSTQRKVLIRNSRLRCTRKQ